MLRGFTGFFITRYILAHFPLTGSQDYIYLGIPAWCQDDLIIAGLNLTPGKHGYYTMSYPWNRPWQTGQKTYDNLGGIVIRRDSKSSGGKAWVLAFDWQTKAFRKFAGIGKTSLDWKNQPWLHVMYNRFFATRLDRPDDFVSVVAARTLDTSEEIQTLIRLGANPLEILLGPDPNWSESNPKPSNKKG